MGDFIASLLGAIGVIGRPRRRKAIIDDLDLLARLQGFEQFAPATNPHTWLSNHIALQIAEFSGLDTRTKKRAVGLGTVSISALITAGLGYLTYYLRSHFGWWCVFAAVPAAFFALITLTMFFSKEEVLPTDDSENHDD
jgi:hypothetical protein